MPNKDKARYNQAEEESATRPFSQSILSPTYNDSNRKQTRSPSSSSSDSSSINSNCSHCQRRKITEKKRKEGNVTLGDILERLDSILYHLKKFLYQEVADDDSGRLV